MTSVDRNLELDLVARLQRRDTDAFDQVYAAFNPRLFNYLARLSRNRDVAEDLVEETWLRVVTHAHRLRDDTRLAPWLFTIARNLYTSYCRSRLVDYDAMAGLALWPVQPSDPCPFEAASAGELQQRVETALASLPPTYREALLLVALEDMTPSEAAEVCGITPAAMRQRLARARSLLARRLDVVGAGALHVLSEVLP
jgi:RNA polymerase sigma-70 factor (ECF subfamily)